jgi:alpha-L-arabinofuranosidase
MPSRYPSALRCALCGALALSFIFAAQVLRADVAATLEVDVAKPGTAIPPDLNGLMTEEINHSYDGGLYAELIQNRTFQDPRPKERDEKAPPMHWFVVGAGDITADRNEPVNAALPVSLRLDLRGAEAGIANDGYWGIPIRPDTTYTAQFYAKGGGGFAGPITASLRLDDGSKVVAKAESPAISGAWKKYTVTLKTAADAPTTSKAKFVLTATGNGSVSFSYVSLFPPTYQDAKNGLRPDIMKLLADMQPKFIRLPGGNYVEGNRFSDRFNWKKMIGPPEERPGHMGCWSYRSSDGFGLPEYLLWCKQLNAEPVLAVFAGYTLNGDHVDAGSPELEIYTNEALEEIEYITGAADSEWGKRRVADGLPEPFKLKYVEIGNEDWFDKSGSYDGRFTQIAKAIRAKYPNLKLIATAPVKSFNPDLYDDHFYRSPRQLRELSTLYDKPGITPPKFEGGGWNSRLPGVKTFVGEWAAHEGKPITDLNAGLADAAFLLGIERNSDAAIMQCYAPLFANVNLEDKGKGYARGWQWEYNLIGYDALRSFGSPSYHAQVMLAKNKGDVVLPTKLDTSEVTPEHVEPSRGAVGLGSWTTDVEYADFSVTAPDGTTLLAPEKALDIKTWDSDGGEWQSKGKTLSPKKSDVSSWAFTGDPKWTDYTIRVRARKNGGKEGFIVIWHAADNDNYKWWNVGGWGNTTARTEVATNGARNAHGEGKDFTVDTGRWYDLRLEVKGTQVQGFVDDKLVTDTKFEPEPTTTAAPVYATATLDKATNTILVKVVNASPSTVDATINLRGVAKIDPNATAIVLAGGPKDVNTLDEPEKVAPKQQAIANAGPSFTHKFAPHSFTILRLKK